jgi:hypothetical protein
MPSQGSISVLKKKIRFLEHSLSLKETRAASISVLEPSDGRPKKKTNIKFNNRYKEEISAEAEV